MIKNKVLRNTLAMQILLWGQGLDFFCPFAGHILYVLNQQKKVIVITGLSVTVNIIADVILIKHYGIVGASIAMIISLSVMFGGYAYALQKWLPISQLLKQLYPPLLIALIFSPVAWFLR
ncbi:polysaccharide biosynthesis C-terminal domain-containing protein, partial [bacterium]|nr:polysaccharide biosynthesis C-terminal domain-containing protein [bacterium]